MRKSLNGLTRKAFYFQYFWSAGCGAGSRCCSEAAPLAAAAAWGGHAGRKAAGNFGQPSLLHFKSEEDLSLVSKAQPEIRAISGAPGLRISVCKKGFDHQLAFVIRGLCFSLAPGLPQLHGLHFADSFNFHLWFSCAWGLRRCTHIIVLAWFMALVQAHRCSSEQ